MKHVNISNSTGSIERNESYEGERIEEKIERILMNNEPIQDGAPLIYTERKDGVKAEFNIRTDRFEIALEAMDAVSRTMRGQRDNVGLTQEKEGENNNNNNKESNGGAESIQTTA